MPIINRQSREEKEFRLRMKLGELKKRAEEYADQCKRLSGKFEKQAAEAAKIENRVLARNFARKSLQFEVQAKRARSFVLVIEDLELSKEQQAIMNSISSAMKDFVKSVSNGKMNASWASSIETGIEQAIDESAKVDGYFGDFLDNFSNQTMATENMSDEDLVRRMGSEESSKTKEQAPFSDEELEERIEKGLKKLNQND